MSVPSTVSMALTRNGRYSLFKRAKAPGFPSRKFSCGHGRGETSLTLTSTAASPTPTRANTTAPSRTWTRPSGRKPDFTEAYSHRGTIYSYKGKYDRAIADLDQAIRLKPVAEAYNNRGRAHADKGYLDQAITDLDQALRLKPDLAEAYNNRGIAYTKKRQYDRGIADFDQAIRLRPGNAEAYFGRGVAHHRKGDPAKALIDFRVAARLLPTSDPWYRNRALQRHRRDRDRAGGAIRTAARGGNTRAPPRPVHNDSRHATGPLCPQEFHRRRYRGDGVLRTMRAGEVIFHLGDRRHQAG